MKINDSIGGVYIECNLLTNPPYISLNFSNEIPTKTQQDLIYRVYFEFYEKLIHYKSLPYKDSITSLTRTILLEDYTKLFLYSREHDYVTVTSYLLSNSLIDKDLVGSSLIYISPNISQTKYADYYVSLLNILLIKERPDIFDVFSFSKYIKYSDDFIDNNFSKFIGIEITNSELHKDVFSYIDVQKPSFGTLIKHIGEFNIEHAIRYLILTKTQIDELKLLNKIII